MMKYIPGHKITIKKKTLPIFEVNKTYMVHHILPLGGGRVKYSFVCEGKLLEQEFESIGFAESLIEKMVGSK